MYPTADKWILPVTHQGLDRFVTDLTFLEVEGATHWLPEERTAFVSQKIRDYLSDRSVT